MSIVVHRHVIKVLTRMCTDSSFSVKPWGIEMIDGAGMSGRKADAA